LRWEHCVPWIATELAMSLPGSRLAIEASQADGPLDHQAAPLVGSVGAFGFITPPSPGTAPMITGTFRLYVQKSVRDKGSQAKATGFGSVLPRPSTGTSMIMTTLHGVWWLRRPACPGLWSRNP
jgi:hypothetical protein